MPSDNSLIPISDEQAKAAQEMAKLGQDSLHLIRNLGGAIKELLGEVTKDLIGVAIGDRLRLWRLKNAAKAAVMADEILNHRGTADRETTGVPVVRALLDAAGDEDRPDLQMLWAKLLAATMDPTRSGRVRAIFVTTVKAMDPIDALVFQALRDLGNVSPSQGDFLAGRFKWRPDEVETSFGRLQELGLGANLAGSGNFILSPRGRELLRALAD
jgi:Abortive infection alpha